MNLYPTLDTDGRSQQISARQLHHALHDHGLDADVQGGERINVTLSGTDARRLTDILREAA